MLTTIFGFRIVHIQLKSCGQIECCRKMSIEYRLKYLYKPQIRTLLINNQHLKLSGLQTVISMNHCKIDETNQSQYDWELLEGLYLGNNQLDGQDVQALLSIQWNNLKQLSFSRNNIGGVGIKYFVRGTWPNLEDLTLVDTKQTNASIKLLCKFNFRKLKFLRLACNQLTIDSMHELQTCYLPLAQNIFLSDNENLDEICAVSCASMPVKKIFFYNREVNNAAHPNLKSLLNKLSCKCQVQYFFD